MEENLSLAVDRLEESRNYWMQKLYGISENLKLPCQGFGNNEGKAGIYNYLLPEELCAKIKRITRNQNLAIYVLMQAALKILLFKHADNEDIYLASPIYMDSSQHINKCVILRDILNENMTFKEVLLSIKDTTQGAYKNQHYPVRRLIEALGINNIQLFKIILYMEDIHKKEFADDIKVNFKNDLSLLIKHNEKEICIDAEYDIGLFNVEKVTALLQCYVFVIEQVLQNTDIKLKDIELASNEQRGKILDDINNTAASYPFDKTIHRLFEEQVRKSPGKVALVQGNEIITYGELNKKANCIAWSLQERGVGKDDIVALFMERSPELIAGMLGVLKTGGAYLPVDPSYPQARVLSMLNDSKTSVILTDEKSGKGFSLQELQSVNQNHVEPHSTCARSPLDFERSSLPDRSLVDYNRYFQFIGMAMVKNAITIQGSRGCPYNCAYCHKIWSKRCISRSAENIFAEVKMYYDVGIRRFAFIDDIFNLDSNNVSKFCRMVLDNGLKIQVFFPNGLRGDILTKENIDLMVQAGTVNFAFALETASPRLQQMINKNINLTKLRENIGYIAEQYPDIILELFAMHGFPTESEEEALMTLDFITSIKWIHFPYFHILKIYPNTDMEKIALENGISKEAIEHSADLGFHELPLTLPFTKSFTNTCQSNIMNEYFLLKERLLQVLPRQMKILTENEIVQKYNSYLPAKITCFKDLLDFAGITKGELGECSFAADEFSAVPGFNEKIKAYFPEKKVKKDAFRILLLDLSQFFAEDVEDMLYDVVEPPLGLMYLLTYIKDKFGEEVCGKIAKSRIDFSNYGELRKLIDEFKPDLLGIRALTFHKRFFHKTVSLIRQWGIKAPIIAGGPYATSEYMSILRDKYIDLVVIGEGEVTFSELVKKMIENGKELPEEEELKEIDGIAFVEKKQLGEGKSYYRDILWGDLLYKSNEDMPNLPDTSGPGDLAYIIYTSGTTGKPKGVMIEHRNVVRLLLNSKIQFSFTENDAWTMFHSPSFDFSVWEIYGALLYGGKLVIISKDEARDFKTFAAIIVKENITVLNQVPSAFYALMNHMLATNEKNISLRYIIFGGEMLKPHLLKEWLQVYPEIKLINMYGITETTVHATYKEITEKEIMSGLSNIGRPIPTTTIYVMDRNLCLTPVGFEGELCVGGEGLARGYLFDQELTAAKFVANPFQDGEKLYRSGDLARFLPDGDLEYLGRIDNQLKIRGYRVEKGEVESRLLKHPQIKECVVLSEEENGTNQLFAYIVCDGEITTVHLRDFLARELPEYMLPSYFIQLEYIPLTMSSKVDTDKLLDMGKKIRFGSKHQSPETETERVLHKIWQEVLAIDELGIDDDFFEIGGHSLKAINLESHIRKHFHADISFAEIFKTPTIRGIAKLIENSAGNTIYTVNLLPVEKRDYYPVSSSQKRIYIVDQFEGTSTAYNMPGIMIVEGSIDRINFAEAFQKLVRRHETLRTSFIMVDGELMQKIHDERDYNIIYLKGEEDKLDEIVAGFIRPFDLEQDPLVRVALVEVDEEKHLLMFDMHHIISDGISMNILIRDFLSLYNNEKLPPIEIQYKDYSVWQSEIVKLGTMKKQEEYWVELFKGEIPSLNMPLDYPRPSIQSFEGTMINFSLDEDQTKGIKNIAQKAGTTVYMTLLAILNVLLYKYTGQEDILVGTTIAGRPHADLNNVIGMFLNTLVMRNYPHGKKSFSDFLQGVKENCLEAYENQDYQFADLVEKLNLKRDLSRNTLFDVIFMLQNNDSKTVDIGELRLTPYANEHRVAKFDLSLSTLETDTAICFEIEYCTKLFKKETMERFIAHFKQIVEQVIGNSAIILEDIDILTADEKNTVLNEFNNTHIDYPSKTIHELFEEQVEKTPGNIALVYEEESLTYAELNRKANSLARVLRDKGIGPNSIVAIIVEKSLEMAVGMLGIMKAGGAYLPVDPGHPQERIKYMLTDSNSRILLTSSYLSAKCQFNLEVIELDKLAVRSGENTDLEIINQPDDLAYVIYTSGTTGNPKGVLIEHKSIVNTLNWRKEYYQFNKMDAVLQIHSFCFDSSVEDIFSPLLSGSKLVIINQHKNMDTKYLREKIIEHRITHFLVTPAFYNALLENCLLDIDTLRIITVAGESVKQETVWKHFSIFGNTRLVNEYGPTENSVCSTFYEFSSKYDGILIGKPIANTKVYILNKYMHLVPAGISGELCIAGCGLARGYLNQPSLTEEKFVANPFAPEERLYKTGDLARWLPDGNLEFLGRIDKQVKIRGHRIELGEIENRLLSHQAIKEAVVINREDGTGNEFLCAYFVADKELPILELKLYLGEILPGYMIPSFFIQLEKIPLAPNGKIDANALPDPAGERTTDVKYNRPTNEVEEKLVPIWEEILGVKEIGIDDSFFDLGGHSLKTLELVTRLHKEFDVEVPLREFFKRPTCRELAEYILNAAKSTYIPLALAEEREYYPLSSAQRRLFLLDQMEGASTAYNMPGFITMEGYLDRKRFSDAFKLLIKRHESLRSSFMMLDGALVQKIHEDLDSDIIYLETTEEKAKEVVAEFVIPFDLSRAPLLRVCLIKLRDDKHVFIYDMHHIISDAVSMQVLMRELTYIYNRKKLPVLKIQYKDYSSWQNTLILSGAIKKQEAFWLELLKGEIPVLNMPLDYPRPLIQSFEGDYIVHTLGKGQKESLETLAKEHGATLFMLILAAFNTLLYKYTGQEDIVVGSPIAGRSHEDLQNVIGLFVNMLPMRNYPCGEKKFNEFLIEVKESCLSTYENQDYQFEDMIEKLSIRRDMSRNPIFDVIVTFQSMNKEVLELEGLKLVPFTQDLWVAKFDLSISALETEAGLFFGIEYCTKLFKRETVDRLTKHLINILLQVAENPEVLLKDIDMLTEKERHSILYEFNNTRKEYPKDKTIHELFDEQAEKYPDKKAVIYNDSSLTYREINLQANSLARVLRSKGVGPDQIVGVIIDKSLKMLIAILGILKAGGAYLPIDPEYPEERIHFMLDDAEVKILLCKGYLHESLTKNREVINVENENFFKGCNDYLEIVNSPSDLAYAMYTSGTTGRPKGIKIEHRGVVRLVKNTNVLAFNEKDRILSTAPVIFDVFIFECWGTLLNGLSLFLVDKNSIINAGELAKTIKHHEITILWLVSPLFTQLAQYNPEMFSPLRYLIVGGDVLSPKHINAVRRKCPGLKIVNGYGPTENSTFSTTFLIEEDYQDNIPIGKPVNNSTAFILDENHNLLPVGITGELCVGGDGLARGYLNRPELTKEKFIPNPFIPGERLYKTGDLARWLPDGNIEFLGRTDYQVKVRGFRIELGEIEGRLKSHKAIREAIVTVDKDVNGDNYLSAYWVSDYNLTALELKDYLQKSLPDYMIPTHLIQLEKMPLTPSGKIDRKVLPKIKGELLKGSEYIAPKNEIQEELNAIWEEVLGITGIGINDNFFELGGHSLSLLSVLIRINEKFKTNIAFIEIIKEPYIKAIAKLIETSSIHENHNYGFPILFNKKKDNIIFCFPGVIGTNLVFRELASHIDSHSIYAFDYLEEEDKVLRFIKLLTSIQSQGPFILLGYSAGGYLAFEVAKEMESQGYNVSDIIIIDSVKMPNNKEITEADYEELENAYYPEIIHLAENEQIAKQFLTRSRQFLAYFNQLQNSGLVHANIHLLISKNRKKAEIQNWNRLTQNGFRIYQGFGEHMEMLKADFAEHNANVLREVIKNIDLAQQS